MSHLTEQQLQQFAELLARREAELQEEVRALKEATANPAETPGPDTQDGVDVGDALLLSGLDHVQLLRDQEELIDIEDARERMRNGRYGHCLRCAEAIPYARLLVKPMAKFCLVHQAEWDRTHPAAPPFKA